MVLRFHLEHPFPGERFTWRAAADLAGCAALLHCDAVMPMHGGRHLYHSEITSFKFCLFHKKSHDGMLFHRKASLRGFSLSTVPTLVRTVKIKSYVPVQHGLPLGLNPSGFEATATSVAQLIYGFLVDHPPKVKPFLRNISRNSNKYLNNKFLIIYP